ncbi:hypothetical protein ACFLUC_03340 [Chloroflexota bacterium]
MDIRKLFVFVILFMIVITACGRRPSVKIPKPDASINISKSSSGSSASRDTSSDTTDEECSGSHEIILKNKTGMDLDYVAFKYPGKNEYTRMGDDTTNFPNNGEVKFLVKAGTYEVKVRSCHPAAAQCDVEAEWIFKVVEVCDRDVTLDVENE